MLKRFQYPGNIPRLFSEDIRSDLFKIFLIPESPQDRDTLKAGIMRGSVIHLRIAYICRFVHIAFQFLKCLENSNGSRLPSYAGLFTYGYINEIRKYSPGSR